MAVASEPSSVLMQFSLCYGMMPLLALTLGKVFGLEAGLMAGMVLVGSINGGQASNLCTYIAKGNVALSVLMTTATTVGAIIMTPFLCKSLLGAVVPVDAKGIAMSTIQVVLAPIAVGMTANKFFPQLVKAVLPFAPVVGVVSTCLLVASAVAQVAEPILNAGIGLQVRTKTRDLDFHTCIATQRHSFLSSVDPCSSPPSSWRNCRILAPQSHWIRRSQVSYYGY